MAENIQNYDAAISYRHDTGFYMAQIIYSYLTANGYTVFMDKTMNAGKYEDKIRNAIRSTRNFLVILFPGDIEACKSEESWLSKEAQWAIDYNVPNIVPIMCDGFRCPDSDVQLSESIGIVLKNQGLSVHKDYSLDSDLDSLRDTFLKNVTPSKPSVTTDEFFRNNLSNRDGFTVESVDVAFHAGAPWLSAGEKKDMMLSSLKNNVKWRVLINTIRTAESIGKHMRDETALYTSFKQARAQWKKLAEMYPNALEVRECNIPLIHIHHCVKMKNNDTGDPYGEVHIKYYAYNNTRTDNAFEHQMSSYSKYYSIYDDEFEYLWEQSTAL